MVIPPGYHRLAPGIRCRCIHSRVDDAGDGWCCGGKPVGLKRADADEPPPESYFDVDLEILAMVLHLAEHGIRIARVGGSPRKRDAITVVIEGDGIPAGECIATYRQVADLVVLDNIRGAGEPRPRR